MRRWRNDPTKETHKSLENLLTEIMMPCKKTIQQLNGQINSIGMDRIIKRSN